MDIFNPPTAQLPSRRPIWQNPPPADLTIQSVWEKEWESKDVPNKHLGSDPTLPVPSNNLPREQWTTLNRFRTRHVPCLASLHKWGSSPTPQCACGEQQTMHTSLKHAVYKDLKEDLSPFIQQIKRQLLG